MSPLLVALHGIGSRQDLPLPFELVLVGAAITLLVTFLLLAQAWRTPRYRDARGKELPRLGRAVDSVAARWALRGLVAALYAIIGVALVVGADRIDNPVFGFVFVWVWVGLVPLSLIFGRLWRRANPVRTLTSAFGTAPPDTLWPAAFALFGFCFLELVQPERTSLAVMRTWVALWLVWLLVGVLVNGRRWIGMADPFEAYASCVARLSCWSRGRSGILMVTSPLRNLASWAAPRGLAALCVVLLGGTAFDSFSNVVWWVQFTQSSEVPRWVWGTLGLLTMTAIVAVSFYGGAALTRIKGRGVLAQADMLAPGLVPIVTGYALAHYGTLLWLEGQRTGIQLSDPFGRGWNLFGTAELGVNTSIIAFPMLIALAQVLCIVGGHVLGVLVSHDIAIRHVADDGRVWGTQAKAQLPLLAVMVGYTISGLLLLFA